MYLLLREKMSSNTKNFQKQKVNQLPEFISRISVLLSEGYKLLDCISMLLPYHLKSYQRCQQQIEEILSTGGGTTEIFRLLGLKKQYLVAVELAEVTGKLAETLEQISKQITFQADMQKKFGKVLMYPALLFVFIMGLFIAFRTYFLPNMTSMLSSRSQGEQTTSIQWAKFFLHLPDYFIMLGITGVLLLIFSAVYIQRKRVDIQLNILFKIPFIGLLWRLILTRQFARSLGNLLLTGFSLQSALDYLQKQTHQKQLAYVAEVIQARLIYGDSLCQSVQLLGYFYPKFEQFIAHGEASGLLGRELIIYCELLDAKLQNTIQLITSVIQPAMFIIIAACVIAAYLSILLPMYNLLDFI